MKCRDVRQKLKSYLDEKLTAAESSIIEEHLDSCSRCQEAVDREIAGLAGEPVAAGPAAGRGHGGLSPARQDQILKQARWKTRLSMTFYVGAAFLGIFLILSIVNWLYYFQGLPNRYDQASLFVAALTEMSFPNVAAVQRDKRAGNLFSAAARFDLVKAVGREFRYTGRMEMDICFNRLTVERYWSGTAPDARLFFVYPGGGTLALIDDSSAAWDTLARLPEGTVAELAVSFTRTFTLAEAHAIFSEYDLALLWSAIDTGQEIDAGILRAGAWGELWGFNHYSGLEGLLTAKETVSGLSVDELHGDWEQKAGAFTRALAYVAENHKWAGQAIRRPGEDLKLPERLAFVQANGVKVYGVVVTGPTGELLRLRERPELRYAALGEVAWWNWDKKSFHGIAYD
jgi:hypothetical protein